MTTENTFEQDRKVMEKYISNVPDTKSVAHFKPSKDIIRLPIRFDIKKLRQSVDDLISSQGLILM